MSRGAVPSGRPDGGVLRRIGLALPFGIPARLGLAASAAHPGRAAMTLGALMVGVAAVTFSVSLDRSLFRVMEDLNRSQASPIRVELHGSSPAPEGVTAAIASLPETDHQVAIGQADVVAERLGTIPFVGYDGDSTWLGYAVIEGRWSTAPGEAVAPTNLFTRTGLHVGDAITLTHGSRSATVRLVGEIFDTAREDRDDLVLRGAWADLTALDPTGSPDRWESAPMTGTDPALYREDVQSAVGEAVSVGLESDSSTDESFLLFLSVVGLVGIVLVVISLGGVLNTVLLETRQRTHEIAVLKAVGLTPFQVVGMVVLSVVPIGLLAGALGVPLGIVAQHVVLSYMGQVAANTHIPASVFDVLSPALMAVLAVTGLAIGLAGAALPASSAARARIAPVLQAE
jgi:putative ABC transport system permease protein